MNKYACALLNMGGRAVMHVFFLCSCRKLLLVMDVDCSALLVNQINKNVVAVSEDLFSSVSGFGIYICSHTLSMMLRPHRIFREINLAAYTLRVVFIVP